MKKFIQIKPMAKRFNSVSEIEEYYIDMNEPNIWINLDRIDSVREFGDEFGCFILITTNKFEVHNHYVYDVVGDLAIVLNV